MCYSAKSKQDFRDLQRRYLGKLSWEDFVEMVRQRERGGAVDFAMKIPDELIAGLIDLGGSAAKEIELLQRRWKVTERRRLGAALAGAKLEWVTAETKLLAKPNKTAQDAFDTKGRKVLRAQKDLEASSVAAAGDYRIYPLYFAPILIEDGAQRLIVPARYRILPRTGLEVPMCSTPDATHCEVRKIGNPCLAPNTASSRSYDSTNG